MRPSDAFAVEPGSMHAGLLRTLGVERRIIADMQNMLDRDTCSSGSGFENAGVGLGDAKLACADGAFKVAC